MYSEWIWYFQLFWLELHFQKNFQTLVLAYIFTAKNELNKNYTQCIYSVLSVWKYNN